MIIFLNLEELNGTIDVAEGVVGLGDDVATLELPAQRRRASRRCRNRSDNPPARTPVRHATGFDALAYDIVEGASRARRTSATSSTASPA